MLEFIVGLIACIVAWRYDNPSVSATMAQVLFILWLAGGLLVVFGLALVLYPLVNGL